MKKNANRQGCFVYKPADEDLSLAETKFTSLKTCRLDLEKDVMFMF